MKDCLGQFGYRRAALGGGEASIDQSGEGLNHRRTLLFAAVSDPKRARGVSRLGCVRKTY